MTDERRRLELPDRRKHTYEELEVKLDAYINKIETRLSRWLRRGLIAFAIIGVACVVALAGFGIVLRQIQQQRYDFCVSQNERRTNTTATLVAAAKEDEDDRKTEAGKAEVRRRRDVTLGLIQAIAPNQDCSAIAPEGRFLP